MIKYSEFVQKYKKLVIWGAGRTLKLSGFNGLKPSYIVDSDKNKWGSHIGEFEICDPRKLYEEDVRDTVILICSIFEIDILKTIRSMNVKLDVYTPSMLYPNPFEEVKDSYIENRPEMFFSEGQYSAERNVQCLIFLLKAHGIRKIVASPGHTNVCFVTSIQNDPFFEIYSSVDERSAAYLACGLAEETGEPVALSCTGATASRNYMPGLTEAFYRKLPVLAITSSQRSERIGNDIPQVTDRTTLPNDIAKISVQLPIVNTNEELRYCEKSVNAALLELTHAGGGPVHINLITEYNRDYITKSLPYARIIRRIGYTDDIPLLPKGKIAIYVGAHSRWSAELTKAVDCFCKENNAVVLCDHTSNYFGKYQVLAPLVLNQKDAEPERFDLLIHIGNVSGAYLTINTSQVWRVNPDGDLKDPFLRLRYVFEMCEIDFFKKYAKAGNSVENEDSPNITHWKYAYDELLGKIPELPFSNIWVASKAASQIPKNAVVHFGILHSLRSWNFFEMPEGVCCYANTGGFGIDGGISSLIGASLGDASKLCFGIVGDLAFFYDMNALGNRHIGNNVRIMVVNNGGGTEMMYGNTKESLGDDVGAYAAATGHFGAQSPCLIKHYAQDLGFEYISASNKEDFMMNKDKFLNPDLTDKPIVFEIFTQHEQEQEAREKILSL